MMTDSTENREEILEESEEAKATEAKAAETAEPADEEAKQEAVVYRENVYNNFYILTQNIVSLGENIEGIDLYDVKEWAPDKYIDETINGTAN